MSAWLFVKRLLMIASAIGSILLIRHFGFRAAVSFMIGTLWGCLLTMYILYKKTGMVEALFSIMRGDKDDKEEEE